MRKTEQIEKSKVNLFWHLILMIIKFSTMHVYPVHKLDSNFNFGNFDSCKMSQNA